MKNIKLEKVLTILVILAICLISFVGIFVKKQGWIQNILPEFTLGMNLTGARVANFVVSDHTKEVIYDAQGNVTTEGTNEDGSLKEGYTKQTEPENKEEVLIEENFQTAKNIMEKRLKKLGINEYTIKLNSTTGEIMVELPENDHTDEALSNLTYMGKFEIKDSQTKEVLLSNKQVKHASAVYGSIATGTTVFLRIEFDKEGRQKLEEMTKTYISTTDEEGNTVTKNISIELDGESMLNTYFGETITTGILQLSIGSATTSNEELATYIEQASRVAGLIDSGVMDIHYELEGNNFISTPVNSIQTKIIIIVIMVVLASGFIYWGIRYRKNGVYASILYLGWIAITLLVIRYANVPLSWETVASIVSMLVANYAVLQYALVKFASGKYNKTEIIKDTYKRYASILFPLLIIGIVATFMTWLPIASIGMVLFWGMTILALYDYIMMKLLLDVQEVEN